MTLSPRPGTLSFVTLGINYDSFMAMDSDIGTIRTALPAGFEVNWEVPPLDSPCGISSSLAQGESLICMVNWSLADILAVIP